MQTTSIELAVETAVLRIEQCFQHYLEKFGKLNNSTAVQIVRTIESQIIKDQKLSDVRAVRNRLRSLIMMKMLSE